MPRNTAIPCSYRPRTAPYGVLTTGSVRTAAVICPPASSPLLHRDYRAPQGGPVFRRRARFSRRTGDAATVRAERILSVAEAIGPGLGCCYFAYISVPKP